jgi:hypothetical protein
MQGVMRAALAKCKESAACGTETPCFSMILADGRAWHERRYRLFREIRIKQHDASRHCHQSPRRTNS